MKPRTTTRKPPAKKLTPPKPIAYSPEIAAKVCAAVAEGDKSIRAICALPDMPAKATFFRWLAAHPEFAAMYEIAKAEAVDTHVDEAVEIADNCKKDPDSIRKARLQIHARIERAQLLQPKKYGRQLQLTGEGGGPVETKSTLNVAGLPTEVLAEIMKAKDASERE